MTTEIYALGAACVLGLVQILLASHSASLQRGYRWTGSARDEPVPPLTGIAGRLARALANFGETFPIFVAALLAAYLAGAHDWRTQWGSMLYVAARCVYLPLYAAGVPIWRSMVWNVAIAGIALILWSALAH